MAEIGEDSSRARRVAEAAEDARRKLFVRCGSEVVIGLPGAHRLSGETQSLELTVNGTGAHGHFCQNPCMPNPPTT